MQDRRSKHPKQASLEPPVDDWDNPQGCYCDMHERLKPIAFERFLNRAPKTDLLELLPVRSPRRYGIDYQGYQGQSQEPPDDSAVRLKRWAFLQLASNSQPERESHRKEKLRHDRIGIA